jgi:hypothetical protein
VSPPEEWKEAETHLVGPVEILEDQQYRSPQGKMPDELRHALEELAVVHRVLRGPVAGNAQLGEKACQLGPPRRVEALDRFRISVDVPGTQGVDPWGERQDLLGFVTASHEDTASTCHRLGGDLGQQATLADARLADHDHELAVSLPRSVQSFP